MPVKKPRDASRIAHMRWMGSRLRRAREEKGLTQSEVAKKLGFAQSWLANIEKAENGLDAIEEPFRMRDSDQQGPDQRQAG